jgi:hypothetical protein
MRFFLDANMINSVLKVFLKTVTISKLQNAITVVELGRYRIRKL